MYDVKVTWMDRKERDNYEESPVSWHESLPVRGSRRRIHVMWIGRLFVLAIPKKNGGAR